MKMSGNTILITGGGSGIGRALAEAFQAAGNQVIITGRRQSALDETTRANPGMAAYAFDVEDPASIQRLAEQVAKDHPALNVLINNAGIMQAEIVTDPKHVAVAEATIAINLLGPIRLTSALLPLLLKQKASTLMTVSSGLAFPPLAINPTYSATKAAIHSWSQSLRFQLRDTPVRVIELVPPYVQTELQGARQASDPMAMPLADFISEVLGLLETTDSGEILVERVKAQRFAERSGDYDNFFTTMNEHFMAMRKDW